MASFDQALPFIFRHEGLYSNSPYDHGGETFKGVTRRYAEAKGYHGDLRDLTDDQIGQWYKEDFWRFDGLNDQRLATYLCDKAVNMSLHRAVRLLQDALNHPYQVVVPDGIYGPKTEAQANWHDQDGLLNLLVLETLKYYRSLIDKDESQIRFWNGWKARAQEIP